MTQDRSTFKTNKANNIVCKNISEVIQLYKKYEELRNSFDYDIDGAVVKKLSARSANSIVVRKPSRLFLVILSIKEIHSWSYLCPLKIAQSLSTAQRRANGFQIMSTVRFLGYSNGKSVCF